MRKVLHILGTRVIVYAATTLHSDCKIWPKLTSCLEVLTIVEHYRLQQLDPDKKNIMR